MDVAGAHSAVVDTRLKVAASAVVSGLRDGLVITPEDFSASANDILPPADLAPEELAFIQFTSGTTSAPKGVMVSHRALLTNARCIGEGFAIVETDSAVFWLPLYHDMGLVGGVVVPLA